MSPRAHAPFVVLFLLLSFATHPPGDSTTEYPSGGEERVSRVLGSDLFPKTVDKTLRTALGAPTGDGASRQAGGGTGAIVVVVVGVCSSRVGTVVAFVAAVVEVAVMVPNSYHFLPMR